ncbi:hypothetical protein ACJJTC_002510 [Scirpophaga incertulas]
MSDYPDPEEEYELLYADDLDLLREQEAQIEPDVTKKKTIVAKRSLDFSSPVSRKNLTPVVNHNLPVPSDSRPSSVATVNVFAPVSANKRTVDELFGDINDIDFDSVELPSKRQKTDEEKDQDLINKILERRKLKHLLLEPSNIHNDTKNIYEVEENLSLDIPRWAFLPLTNANGDRIYVKLESEDAWEDGLGEATNQSTLHSMYTKTWEEARRLIEKKQQDVENEKSQEFLPNAEVDINENNLWVQKYKPQTYFDLLTDEPVNRALLHWLHLWDKVVFKKDVITTEPQQRNSFRKKTGQFQLSNKWKGKSELEPELDEDGRPHYKDSTKNNSLFCLWPGYRPVEVNASDERSVDAFRNALQAATLMRPLLDADHRPNCLVLDEIDGAPLPTVELLVKWCNASVTENAKKKSKVHALRRPVIAICNDLYAPSLRPLRPVSLIIRVGGVSGTRLAARVCSVAREEGVEVGARVAAALAARAAGDTRAALTALALACAARRQLTVEDVENATMGTKDCNKTLMQALQAIFTANQTPGSVLKTVNAAGEYDRIVDGIFENYLLARADTRLTVAGQVLSWLMFYDEVHSWTLQTQNYSLYGVLPLCIMKCHMLLATRSTVKMKFPMQAQEVFKKKSEVDSVFESVYASGLESTKNGGRALRLDILPLLPHLLTPKLRSANVQLCSEQERQTLRVCAGALCDYGLQYIQQRTPEGLYAFQLDPDIYKLASFGNEEKMKPPPPIRQAIAREQQLEVIRRNEEMSLRMNKNATGTDLQNPKEKSVPVASKEALLPNHLQRLKPKEVQKSTPRSRIPESSIYAPATRPLVNQAHNGQRKFFRRKTIGHILPALGQSDAFAARPRRPGVIRLGRDFSASGRRRALVRHRAAYRKPAER